MGRKVEMKKIDDITKCQVTFSKRRSSLIKKAEEISICCDVDVALIAFSPSGRVSKFCSQKRVENVLNRYVNLPTDRRLQHIQNVQAKQEKLHQLDHIMSDASKLHFLDKQIENLELQIKKSTLELQILEADLRDYEPDPELEPSLHQLSWCQRNLKQSLARVMAKRNTLFGCSSSSFGQGNNFQKDSLHDTGNQSGIPSSYNSAGNGNELIYPSGNTSTGQLVMQLDPWISPYSAKVHDSIFKGLVDQARRIPASDTALEACNNHTSNMSIRDLPMLQQLGNNQDHLELQIFSQLNNPNKHVGNILPIQQQLSTFEQNNSFPGRNYPTTMSFNVFPPPNADRKQSGPMYGPMFCNSTANATTSRAATGSGWDNLAAAHVQAKQNLVSLHSSLTTPNLIYMPEDHGSNIDYNDNNNNINSNRNEMCATAVYQVDPTPVTNQDSMFGDLLVEDNANLNSRVQESGTWDWKDLLAAHSMDLEDFDSL